MPSENKEAKMKTNTVCCSVCGRKLHINSCAQLQHCVENRTAIIVVDIMDKVQSLIFLYTLEYI